MAYKLIPYSLLTISTLSGFNYSTHYQHPRSYDKPYVLLMHGFPSSAYDWRHQVDYLSSEGYGLIVPDTLGYGRSSKPLDPHNYVLKSISDSVIEVVDHIAGKDAKVHGVGHDWGSALLSRAANFHADRFLSYSFLAGSYSLPVPFDIDAIIKNSEEQLGYATLGYFKYFNTSEAGPLVDSRQKSFVDLLYPIDWQLWRYHLGPVGALRKWLKNDTRSPRPRYLSKHELRVHRDIFARKNGGYTPALGYYKAAVRGYNAAANSEVRAPNNVTDLPTLFIGGTADPLALYGTQCNITRIFAKGVDCRPINNAGHWPQIESPREVNELLIQHFNKAEEN